MFLPSHIGIVFDYHGGREIWYNTDMRRVAMLKVLRKAIMVIAASIVPAMASSEVMVQQNITLKRGWNAVYIEVAPTVSPDKAFADWPVKSAGFYDPASFLATRQFSQTWESQGLSMKPVATWYRGVPEASQMKYVPAGTVCIAFNTNDEQTVVSVMGVPAAPRMTWHVTDTNEVYNFVGFSLQKGASVSPRDYLDGFDGNFTKSGFYKFSGNDEDASPSITRVYDTAKVSDGDVLLVASDTQSDWSGVLNVSPMGGLDFGSDSSKATLSIRNDGGEDRTVSVAMEIDASYGDVVLPRTASSTSRASPTSRSASKPTPQAETKEGNHETFNYAVVLCAIHGVRGESVGRRHAVHLSRKGDGRNPQGVRR